MCIIILSAAAVSPFKTSGIHLLSWMNLILSAPWRSPRLALSEMKIEEAVTWPRWGSRFTVSLELPCSTSKSYAAMQSSQIQQQLCQIQSYLHTHQWRWHCSMHIQSRCTISWFYHVRDPKQRLWCNSAICGLSWPETKCARRGFWSLCSRTRNCAKSISKRRWCRVKAAFGPSGQCKVDYSFFI